ncbi:MAG: PKD domain-containing protein [Bacteroidales bacterium]
MKKFLLFTGMMLILAFVGLTSCKKDPPTVDFTYVIDGKTVTFTSVVTFTDSYLWNFGDSKTSTDAQPVHVYVAPGDYNVILTVTGPGGNANQTKKLTVLPSIQDLLTGGATATNGKTWVLSTGTYLDFDGASAVTNELSVLFPIPSDIQSLVGVEYDNEFTFYDDGRYSINPKNGKVIAVSLYSTINGIVVEGTQIPSLGLCFANFTAPVSATWTLNTADFTVDAITNPLDVATPPGHGIVTFTGKNWLSFSPGAYFGILDFPTSNQVIIKSITSTEMHVAIMMCSYQGVLNPGGMDFANYPTHVFQLTYVPKAN